VCWRTRRLTFKYGTRRGKNGNPYPHPEAADRSAVVRWSGTGTSGADRRSHRVQRFVQSIVRTYCDGAVSTLDCAWGFSTDKSSCSTPTWAVQAAGARRFRSMVRIYYRGAAAAVLVFDMTSRKSFNKLKDWVRGMRHVCAGTWVDSLAHSVSLTCAGTVPHLLRVACHTSAPGFGLPTSAPGLVRRNSALCHCGRNGRCSKPHDRSGSSVRAGLVCGSVGSLIARRRSHRSTARSGGTRPPPAAAGYSWCKRIEMCVCVHVCTCASRVCVRGQ
jgi:hypothetical protein